MNNIRKMYRTAMQNPNKKFMVGYRNAINEMSLNGYTGGEMIDMFIEAGNIPSNVFFSEEWSKSGKFGTREQVTAREYFTEIFPEGLFNILEANPTMKSMPIFQYMQFVTDENTGKVSMNIQDIGGLAPYQKDEIKESWGDLLRNEQTAELAQSLFLYNYYKLGFTYSPM